MLKCKKAFAKAETDHRASCGGLDESQIPALTKKLKAAHDQLKTVVATIGYMKPLVGPPAKKRKATSEAEPKQEPAES